METVYCTICEQHKSQEDFYKGKFSPKRKGRCKECTKRIAREWKAANPEKNKATNKKWNDNNYSKKRYRDLKREYGITPELYEQMYIEQEGNCKICKRNRTEFAKRLAVDHCHKTGKIRGLLCQNCNTLLGNSFDNPETLKRAVEYLIS
jgi:hypothetical protein